MSARRRRVLYAIETVQAGGAQVAILNLIDHIDRGRFDPIVALPFPGWLSERLTSREVPVVYVDHRTGPVRLDVRLVRSLAACIRAYDVTLVSSFLFSMNVHGTLAARLTRRPIVVNLRSTEYDFAKWYRVWCWKLMRRLSTATVAVSHDAALTLSKAAGIPVSEIAVVPNCVDADRFHAPKGQRPLWLPPPPLVGTVGRVCAVKAQDDLIWAIAHLRAAGVPASLVIVGEETEPTYSYLRSLCDELGVTGHVLFVGLRDDVSGILQWFDVFALPSTTEGMSNALLEAMAAERAVVATAVGGNPEVVRDGQTGLLVPPRDGPALARALRRLLEDGDLARALATAARRDAEQRFSPRAMADAHARIYERAVSRWRGDDRG